jgi:hypothetical protein
VTVTVYNEFSAGSITTTGETIPYGGDPVTISFLGHNLNL